MIIQKKESRAIPVMFVFFGNEEDHKEFAKETGAGDVKYKIIPPEDFFKLSGKSIPEIYFLEEGEIVRKLNFVSFTQEEVELFLQEK